MEVVNSHFLQDSCRSKPYEGPIVGFPEIQVQMTATQPKSTKCKLGAENSSSKGPGKKEAEMKNRLLGFAALAFLLMASLDRKSVV